MAIQRGLLASPRKLHMRWTEGRDIVQTCSCGAGKTAMILGTLGAVYFLGARKVGGKVGCDAIKEYK